MKHLTIGKKMLFIGIIIVMGLTFLAGDAYYTNVNTREASDLAALRNQQRTVLDQMMKAHSGVMLVALEAIIDKDDGQISKDRMSEININLAFFQDNLDELEKMTDTDSERKLAREIADIFLKLAGEIQTDIVRLIEEGAAKAKKIRQDFVRAEHELDDLGDSFTDNLGIIFASMQKEQKKASDIVLLRNSQLGLLNRIMRAHEALMLAAMDAIIDKEKGRISKRRMTHINDNVALIKINMERLLALADTDEEKRAALDIQDIFPRLAQGIQTKLVKLIREHADNEAFSEIDDELDNYGDPITDNLGLMFASVQKEQEEASKISILRNEQIAFLNKIMLTHKTLMLAAKDAIIHKDDGKIGERGTTLISESISLIKGNMEKLVTLAGTEAEKKATESIRDTFPKLAREIQTNLTGLIRKSAVEIKQIKADFVRIDHVLDEDGDRIEENLLKMITSVAGEQKKAWEELNELISTSTKVGAFIFFG